ncbi:MAG: putative thioesterase [Desulfobulbus propionicus]|nr:MAG: putative thioesterase [Desulfobulbus propionicus]
MNVTLHNSPWLIRGSSSARERLRLFCFPYAGGGASIFYSWRKEIVQSVDVCAVQLPGRENRIAEKPYNRLSDLVTSMAEELAPYLDIPFAFFGHSLGAKIAFEFAREIRRRWGVQPVCLFVSGSRPVHIPKLRPLHQLPNKELIEELKQYTGTPTPVLQSNTVMDVYLPILRADFSMDETYSYYDAAPFSCPIIALIGSDDGRADRNMQQEWRQHTTGPLTIKSFHGNHFFIKSDRQAVLEYLSGILTEYVAE